MLPKVQRLTKAKEFQELFRRGRGVRAGSMLLRVAASKDEKMHVAFVVSKKTAPRAVDRNRIRRLLSEAVRLQNPRALEGRNAVFVALPGCKIQNLKEASDLAEQLFIKISKFQ